MSEARCNVAVASNLFIGGEVNCAYLFVKFGEYLGCNPMPPSLSLSPCLNFMLLKNAHD